MSYNNKNYIKIKGAYKETDTLQCFSVKRLVSLPHLSDRLSHSKFLVLFKWAISLVNKFMIPCMVVGVFTCILQRTNRLIEYLVICYIAC